MRVLTELIVCNYRTPHDAKRFVDSVTDTCDPDEVRVWIVDVDPIDSVEALARRLEVEGYPNRYIHVGYNCGYGRAVNMAAAHASGDVIGIFNADTVLTDGVVQACRDDLMENPMWGVVGPRQVDGQGKITHAGIGGTITRPKLRGWKQLDRGQYGYTEECVYVAGSAMFVRHGIWQEMAFCSDFRAAQPNSMGAFLETPHYYEDSWLCSHLRSHGYKVMYKGDVTMRHDWHKASKKGGHADRQMKKSREIFRDTCRAHSIECE